MSEKTHAEITAEMRNYTNECNDGYRTDYGVVLSDMRDFADRLDAAHKREVDEVVVLATRYRTALARINALATYCCQPNVREQIIEQCENIFAEERDGKTKETEVKK